MKPCFATEGVFRQSVGVLLALSVLIILRCTLFLGTWTQELPKVVARRR